MTNESILRRIDRAIPKDAITVPAYFTLIGGAMYMVYGVFQPDALRFYGGALIICMSIGVLVGIEREYPKRKVKG